MSSAGPFETIEHPFLSEGKRCQGTLFLPSQVSNPPVVVMAHGFCAERSFRLPAFAERFVAEGMAVFLFDYRNFGESEGRPRNLVSPRRHLQDWTAAIHHVRAFPRINPHRLALWGTSFSGGHVIVTAARAQGISAIVAQVPFVDGLSTLRELGPRYLSRAVWEGLRDMSRIATFRTPHTVPVVGDPDTFAVMNRQDSKAGYLAMVPEDSSWENRCPARVFVSASFYRPGSHAEKVRCPALVVIAEKDSLIPAGVVDRVASRMPRSEKVCLPVGHFDVYAGEVFEQVVEMEARFLKKHLCGPQQMGAG